MREYLDIILPSYVGAMFIAIILRNINEQLALVEIPDNAINVISDLCLGIFLTMAMMGLQSRCAEPGCCVSKRASR